MGGCASSVLDWRSTQSMKPHDIISTYLAYGDEAAAVPGTEMPGYSPIYRFINTSDEENERLSKEFYYGENLVQSLQRRTTALPQQPALAYRKLERVEKRAVMDPSSGKEKIFSYYHCSSYTSISCAEMWAKMVAFSRGLAELGLSARKNVSIYEETRWEWLVSIYGIWLQDMVATTVYANLGKDALAYALAETQSDAIICNGSQLSALVPLLQSHGLRPLLIILDNVPANTDTADFQVVPWTDVVARGEAAGESIPIFIPADNDAVSLIMYTSGTTGNPKGVVHTHGSMAAGCHALNHRLLDLYRPNEDGEMYCAYLPMAHILEFAIVNIFLKRGTLVGFGGPRTLTDNYALPHGDLREFKPRVIIAVPRIFDQIRKAVEEKLPERQSMKRSIFDRAYASRQVALTQGLDTPFWNAKAFSVPRGVLGGNVYGMLSGGGPLSASTQEFINVVCGGPLIIQGWGLTETVCCGATQRLGDLEPNCVGQLIKTCEVRLKDVDAYKHTDQPEPRGELCMRGPFVFKGYYKQPELTKEAFDEDGWFHTGDVGSITADGKLRIVGRVKALAKNCLGEYIALETLEAIYAQHQLCQVGGVCVVVHPDKPYIAALVLTDEKRATDFAEENGISGTLPSMLESPAFQKAAVSALVGMAKEAGRMGFECVKQVRVLLDEWTPENGLMTPTMKLRRSNVETHYAKEIAALFAE